MCTTYVQACIYTPQTKYGEGICGEWTGAKGRRKEAMGGEVGFGAKQLTYGNEGSSVLECSGMIVGSYICVV